MDPNPELDTEIKPNIPQNSDHRDPIFPRRYVLPVVGLIVLLAAALTFGSVLEKKQPQKIYTIGVMLYIPQLHDNVKKGFFQGMEKMGHKDGESVRYIVTPYGETPEKMQGIAQGLVDQNVDLIVAVTNVAATGAKQATEASGRTNLPIVFSHANTPDATGLIKSFQSSGNNLTGVAVDFVEVTEKKLEFLKQINPNITRIGVFDAAFTDPASKFSLDALQKASPKFGIEIVSYKILNNVGPEATAEIAGIAGAIKSGEIDAFFQLPGPVISAPSNVKAVIDMAKRLKIPAVYHADPQVEQGGLFTYSHDLIAMGEQTAVFADKILRGGQRPTDIPVEFPNKNSLVINAKTAKEIGLTIPESLLLIANRIIQD